MEIEEIVKKQTDYFISGKTRSVLSRIMSLKTLKASIKANIKELEEAFIKDLNKCSFDVVTTELGMVMSELNNMIKNVRRYARPKNVRTTLINFPSRAKVYSDPYGVCLIVSPWNYPFQLCMVPLIGAIGAGNTAIVKPSNQTPNVASVIEKILSVFEDDYIYVQRGGRQENEQLFEQNYNFIFFTGGKEAGIDLLSKSSKKLVPAVLELGGKSPCIVDKDANLNLAAKRIVWGKYLNAGQTCVAPDYILVDKTVKGEFIKQCINWIKTFYFKDDKLSDSFTHIVSLKHAERLHSLIEVERDKIIFGGEYNGTMIYPTIINNVTFEDEIMKKEIFGPIMPILEYSDINEIIKLLQTKESPLALYYFGNDINTREKIISSLRFGGGCFNDTIMHVGEENIPFGGVGSSGIGAYHGRRTFDAFSREKSVLIKGGKELLLKYPPYTDKKEKLARWFFKI